MATGKAGSKAIETANKDALKGFPKAKLREAFTKIGQQASASDEANEERQKAAFNVCVLAFTFRQANKDADVGTVAGGWSNRMDLVALELAADGNRFAEVVKGKGDKPDHARLTGYGNNVKSIAKGVIEFDLNPSECKNDKGETAYREVRKVVEAERAKVRREKRPDEAALKDAQALMDKAWGALREAVLGFKDIGVLNQCTAMLNEHSAEIAAQKAAQDELEKAAKAAATPAEEPTEEPTEEREAA